MTAANRAAKVRLREKQWYRSRVIMTQMYSAPSRNGNPSGQGVNNTQWHSVEGTDSVSVVERTDVKDGDTYLHTVMEIQWSTPG